MRSVSRPFRPTSSGARTRKDLRPRDLERYQTVFARNEGAIAAPTAGLHFTPSDPRGDPGAGRRRPEGHARCRGRDLPAGAGRRASRTIGCSRKGTRSRPAAARTINAAKAAGPARRRPSARPSSGRSRAPAGKAGSGPGRGATSLFIYPGFEFRVVDRLLTNFHLPKSTLLMLVSAFAGVDLIRQAYREAVRERYRFFSYGDCMFIL